MALPQTPEQAEEFGRKMIEPLKSGSEIPMPFMEPAEFSEFMKYSHDIRENVAKTFFVPAHLMTKEPRK